MKNVVSIEKLFALASNEKNNVWLRALAFILLAFFDRNKSDYGSLWRKPRIMNWILSSIGLYGNINNLGNPFSDEPKNYQWLLSLEQQVIKKCSDSISDVNLEGYVTSGGTEANIFLMWLGSEKILDLGIEKKCVVLSSFSHYSLGKSARLMSLPQIEVSSARLGGAHDLKSLIKAILKQYQSGYRGFLIPLTIGYSSTGVSDQYIKIAGLINLLQQKLNGSYFFVWIDAAAQGLAKSVLDNGFRPTKDPLIQGYVVDYHKLGYVPLPAGVVLYRPSLRKLIESKIAYLHEVDATLLGSRPGSSVLGIWSSLFLSNQKKLYLEFFRLEAKKMTFIKKLKEIRPNCFIFSEPKSLTIGVAINDDFPKLNKVVEEKFGLVECEIEGFKHYKIHFIK